MKISVIGLGYVGSVAAASLAADGHDVLGVDVDHAKLDAYLKGPLPIYEPALFELVREGLHSGRLRMLHTDQVSESLGDVIVIATGTPMGETGAADLSQVRAALKWVAGVQTDPAVVVMKSTIPPGTGVRLWESILRDTPLDYVSNPEFLREGQAVSDWRKPDRIVIGGRTDRSIEVTKAVYTKIDAPVVVTDITSAELIKYAANAFLATKISFINEIAALCDRVGATIDDITKGISLDPRIGAGFLRAGVGYGGSCFPKDVRALDNMALTSGHNFELLRSVITVNSRQRLLPFYALRDRFGEVSGLKVGVLGLAFKPHTDDVREAPAVDLIRVLTEHGAQVSAYDPSAAAAAAKEMPEQVSLFGDLSMCVDGVQALVLMTEWPEIVEADWAEVARLAAPPRFLFDGRNVLDPVRMREIGFEYSGVGRKGPNPVEAPGADRELQTVETENGASHTN